MFKNIAKALGGDPLKKELGRMSAVVVKINELEAAYEQLPDTALQAKTEEFKQRLADGQTLDDILPEAFAAVREASKRTTGLRHFDIQLIGGMVRMKAASLKCAPVKAKRWSPRSRFT